MDHRVLRGMICQRLSMEFLLRDAMLSLRLLDFVTTVTQQVLLVAVQSGILISISIDLFYFIVVYSLILMLGLVLGRIEIHGKECLSYLANALPTWNMPC